MNYLQTFAARALRLVPTSLWWMLGALIGAFVSIKLEKELFPNTPAAATVAEWIAMACLVTLPPVGIVWLWQVAMHVEHPGWRLMWYLAAIGATAIGVGLAVLLVIVALLWG
ncbi:hypothetical protein [uncultured Hymenobacter sp.]|uniref:hypothetical protein n=1 Tax=uncultured Hymenobacter sp. TaxID=170016 RepID=UPI0035CBDB79